MVIDVCEECWVYYYYFICIKQQIKHLLRNELYDLHWFFMFIIYYNNIWLHTPSFFNTSFSISFCCGFSTTASLVITGSGNIALWPTRFLVLSEVDFLVSSSLTRFSLGNYNKQDVIIYFQVQSKRS